MSGGRHGQMPETAPQASPQALLLDTPIVVAAPPFCGGHLLAAALGRHPQLCALPALDVFMADTVDELLDLFALGQGTHGQGLLRAIAELMSGRQSEDTVGQAREWLAERRGLHGLTLLRQLAAWAAPRPLVLTEPESMLRPADLLRLRRALPRLRVVHLVRHPYSACLSLAACYGERLFVPLDYKDHAVQPPMLDPQLAWLRAHDNIERYLCAGLPPHLASSSAAREAPHCVRVRIEDFDAQPAAALADLCTALGLSADVDTIAAMQDFTAWPFIGPGPQGARAGLDPDMLEDCTPPADWDVAQRLEGPLPWRWDGAGFAYNVIEKAQAYAYV